MNKNLLFLTFFFSYSAIVASDHHLTQEEKSDKECEFLAKVLTNPDIGPIIFTYLIDENKNLAEISNAIENNMDWKTIGNIMRTVELYKFMQSKKKIYPGLMIKIDPNWIKNYKNKTQQSGLHQICQVHPFNFSISDKASSSFYERQSLIIEEFCHHNADVNAQNIFFNETPLHHAAINNSLAAITKLCNHNADVNARDKYDMTPLHNVAYNKSLIAITTLGFHMYVNTQNNNDENSLYKSIVDESLASIRTLYNHNANVNAQNSDGETPAVQKTSSPKIKALLTDCAKNQEITAHLKKQIVQELQNKFDK